MSSLRLKLNYEISKQCPYIYVGKPLAFEIFTVDNTDQPVKTNEIIKIDVRIHLDDEQILPLDGIVDIVENTNIQRNGVGRIKLRVADMTALSGKAFVFEFSSASPLHCLTPAQTISLSCYRLRLESIENETTPYVWYKDEGGKDKCIDIKVHLQDPNGNEIRDRNVRLKTTLLYSSGQMVENQNILLISPDSKLVIDEKKEAYFKVRINQVSNTHQKQLFQIKISPDISVSPLNSDISPTLCVPVDVKSKRNSDTKRRQSDVSIGGGGVNKKSKSEPDLPSAAILKSLSTKPKGFERDNRGGYGSGNGYNTAVMGNSPNEFLQRIVDWTNNVCEGFDMIRWQQIGFDSSNNSMPLYNITNPESVMKPLLEEMSDVFHSIDQLNHFIHKHELCDSQSQHMTKYPIPSHYPEFDSDRDDNHSLTKTMSTNSLDRVDSTQLDPFHDIGKTKLHREPTINLDGFDPGALEFSKPNGLMRDNSLYLPHQNLLPNNRTSADINNMLFDEAQVSYIFAKVHYDSCGKILGLPAFNGHHTLIGFYVETDRVNLRESSVIDFQVFTSIVERRPIEERFLRLLKSGNKSSIFEGKDIEIVKESAFVYVYMTDPEYIEKRLFQQVESNRMEQQLEIDSQSEAMSNGFTELMPFPMDTGSFVSSFPLPIPLEHSQKPRSK